jgi:putative membrane protein
MMMWWNDYGYGPGPWMFLGPLFMLAMLAVCVVMMFYMMRQHRGSRDDSAAQILKERFARGEIDGHEYEERRRMLEV